MRVLELFSALTLLGASTGYAQVRMEPLATLRSALQLPSYRATDRALLCEQSLLVMKELFVHRELKVQDFGVSHDPVPRLQTLCPQSSNLGNGEFHRAVSDIYIELHDLHTNYVGAKPLACGVAFIPLKLSDALLTNGERQVLVSRKLTSGSEHVTNIDVGMQLVKVDGVNVDQVIESLGNASGGANTSAMRHRAIQMLTMRGAATYPLPENDEVKLEFRKADGSRFETIVPWMAQASTACLDQAGDVSPFRAPPLARAMNMGVDSFQRDYNKLFGQDKVAAPAARPAQVVNPAVVNEYQDRFNRIFNAPSAAPSSPRGDETSEAIKEVFEFSTIRTPAGQLGYINLKSFYWESESLDIGTVTEAFRRMLESQFEGTTGLVVDVRGNPGGFIIFSEKLIQLFAAQEVKPTTVRMLANDLNQSIFIAANGADNRWSAALRDAIAQGKKYMQPMAITPEAEANAIGQVWFKPVVVLTDAGCYSACDLFAAGMQDNGAAVILGLNQHTGAGGANVMEYNTFRQILSDAPRNPFVELPFGHNIRVSWRQTIRAGKNAGELLENRGIISDRIVPLTPQDVLEGESRDLMRNIHVVLDGMAPNYVAGLKPLRGGIVYTANGEAGKWVEQVWGIDRLDVMRGSQRVERLDLRRSTGPTAIDIRLSALDPSWQDERMTLIGIRDNKTVLRVVRDVKWRGAYTAIPSRGLVVDFADGESDVLRTMALAGPDGSGWQVVNGALRVGEGPDYQPRVLTRAVSSLQLNNRGGQVTIDLELAAESQSDVLRIYTVNPDTKERQEVFSGSEFERQRTARFKLPSNWQRCDLVFEFESDENWNMAGPTIRKMSVTQ